MKDPDSGLEYEYSILSQNQYQLCASFVTDNSKLKAGDIGYPVAEIWKHGIGRVCFDRTAGEAPVVPKIAN
jgi:hypothetical protein